MTPVSDVVSKSDGYRRELITGWARAAISRVGVESIKTPMDTSPPFQELVAPGDSESPSRGR